MQGLAAGWHLNLIIQVVSIIIYGLVEYSILYDSYTVSKSIDILFSDYFSQTQML